MPDDPQRYEWKPGDIEFVSNSRAENLQVRAQRDEQLRKAREQKQQEPDSKSP